MKLKQMELCVCWIKVHISSTFDRFNQMSHCLGTRIGRRKECYHLYTSEELETVEIKRTKKKRVGKIFFQN